MSKTKLIFAVYLTAILTCRSEKVWNQDFMHTHEGVMSALIESHKQDKIVKVYSIYDKINSKSILVCVDLESQKCFISFGGHGLSININTDGNIQKADEFFSPEIALVKLRDKNLRSQDENGLLTRDIHFEIGYWFTRPLNKTVNISLASTDGKFEIEWKKDERLPKVSLKE